MRRATTIRIALLALIWGSGFLWIKLAIRGLSPVEVTLTRLVLGSAVLFAVLAARRDFASVPRSAMLWAHIIVAALTGAPSPRLDVSVVASVAILGLVGTGAAYVLNYQIITSEGATVASTVTYLLPVVAIILGVLVLDEPITLLAITGIALILVGVALTRYSTSSAGVNG